MNREEMEANHGPSDQELYGQETFRVGRASKENVYEIECLTATTAGSPEKPNEDSLAVFNSPDTDTFYAAVFDGITNLKPIESLKTQTGARFASHFLSNSLGFAIKAMENQEESTQRGPTPKDLMLELNRRLSKESSALKGTSLEDAHTLPSSTGVIVKVNPDKNILSIAHAGDSCCIVYYKGDRGGHSIIPVRDQNKKFDDKMFDLICQIAQEKGITPKEARQDERVNKAIIEMMSGRNNNPDGSGIGIINGDPGLERYIQSESLLLKGVKAILLMSDGLLPQGWSLEEEEGRQRMLATIEASGFEELLRIKRQSEDDDPDWNNIRYKHSDDATGVLLRF